MTFDETCDLAGREGVLTAVRLMRLALPLLDRGGRDAAATRLQQAIDEADGWCPTELTEEEMTRFLDAAAG